MANKHQMVIAHMYRIDFVWMHNVNELNRPSIDTVYFDRWHDLYMYPMCHDSHVLLDIAVELLDFVPLLQLLNLASHPNNLVDLWLDLAADK